MWEIWVQWAILIFLIIIALAGFVALVGYLNSRYLSRVCKNCGKKYKLNKETKVITNIDNEICGECQFRYGVQQHNLLDKYQNQDKYHY
jgi:hypothetical protein